MNESVVRMPNGEPFAFWDDETEYARVYHVACQHSGATDDGPGTAEQPFATIGRAAELLQPGEKVVVHEGIYRECVRPARGGTGPDAMIAYEAAPGEKVILRGSREWKPDLVPSEGWNLGQVPPPPGARGHRHGVLPEGTTVWTAEMPAEWFVGYHPFMAMNFSCEYNTFVKDWSREETAVFMLRRGMLIADGVPLVQVNVSRQIGGHDGAFFVQDPGLQLHFRLPGDADPEGVTFEVTTQEQIFAPKAGGVNFVRLSGLCCQYAADGFPIPQRAMISASRGHHWIIEDCDLSWANACAIDLGNETWHRWRPGPRAFRGGGGGRHIVRRNHIHDIGICGIAAVGNNEGTLIEDNTIERVGYHNIERLWENGGLKFHTCDSALFRRNIFRHIDHAPGLWLDVMNVNCRITENVFADVNSIKGALYLEACQGLNVLDHNVFWDIRGDTNRPWGDIFRKPGFAVNIDSGENCVFAHNLLMDVPDSSALWFNLDQHARLVAGRVGLCTGHKILNNILVGCPDRILLSRVKGNACDGNLYDERDDFASFTIEYPKPDGIVHLKGWQEYYGFDLNAAQRKITATFDPETLALSVAVDGDLPTCVPVPELHEAETAASPGPYALDDGKCCVTVRAGVPQTDKRRETHNP